MGIVPELLKTQRAKVLSVQVFFVAWAKAQQMLALAWYIGQASQQNLGGGVRLRCAARSTVGGGKHTTGCVRSMGAASCCALRTIKLESGLRSSRSMSRPQ